ncbi:MAG: GNAT family N-acetyltransferase [Acidobacteriota bacterium]|nr:GNAT family N-acetyltransferase [Acidobacteriota bacterium]
MALRVAIAEEPEPALVEALNALVPQLSSHPTPVTVEDVSAIVTSESSLLFVARDGDAIVGVATLALYRVPTGLKAWIEDVVVDEGARGSGVGEALVGALVDEARARGVTAVDLTSRPTREAAHRLYQRLGFTIRETSVYRLTL